MLMLSTLSTKKEIQNLNFETLTSTFTLFLIQPQLPLTAGMSHTAHFKLKWARPVKLLPYLCDIIFIY